MEIHLHVVFGGKHTVKKNQSYSSIDAIFPLSICKFDNISIKCIHLQCYLVYIGIYWNQ